MIRKMIAAALFLAFVPMGVVAADTDKATPPPEERQSSPSYGGSYFQGVWVGSWPGFGDSSSQGISIKIGKKVKDNVFEVNYSWDAVERKRGPVPSGKAKTEGTEQEDKFVFQYETKAGKKIEITLQKHKDNVVKARMEKEGPTAPKERPYNETYLNKE